MSGSHLAGIDLAVLIGFFVVTLAVGIALARAASGGVDSYFLGGRKLPWWLLGISTAASNFDMAGTMVITSVVFALGFKGFLVELRGGVGLSLAFLMILVAKWLRRSLVMTAAEWMKVRFGTDRQGRAAHLVSTVANLLLNLGMIIYFCKGAGKFLAEFLPLSEVTCTVGLVAFGVLYTLLSGLYGVVFTDAVQMVLVAFTTLFITSRAIPARSAIDMPDGYLDLSLAEPGRLGSALLQSDPLTWGPIYGAFGFCVFLWFARSFLEGMGGVGGYTDQRFFAARNEREASLLTAESIVLSALRWGLIAGLVVLGHELDLTGPGPSAFARDPEAFLTIVLDRVLPAGIKGLVIAGFTAAAISTFDSTLNAGASFIVKDLYQSYWKPDASDRQLVRASRLATLGLCLTGVAISALVPNINRVWAFITMGIGAGIYLPLFLRWYWPRFTGYGFAMGTSAGVAAAFLVNALLSWPLYFSFPAVLASALVAAVVGSLLTSPCSDDRLAAFSAQINPWGPWRRYEKRAVELGLLEERELAERTSERRRDAVALLFAPPFQVALLLFTMSLVFQDWAKTGPFAAVVVVTSIGLYFFWYRNLKSPEACAAADARWEERTRRALEAPVGERADPSRSDG